MGDQILAWPSGTGGFKLGLNYVPGFAAAALRYQQLFWLLGKAVAETGTMNVFAVYEAGASSGQRAGWSGLSKQLTTHRWHSWVVSG